ncbi:MAG: PIG-L deacetylase family protein [Candidatus Woesearchaeota archaeon]
MKKSVLVVCAHNDDQILGCGGTLAKYAKAGYEVVTVIFSYGQGSHPWLKSRVTIKMRVKEAKQAERLLGVKKTFYMGFSEGRFKQDIDSEQGEEKLKRILCIIRPCKIFTHSPNDPHPDHRAVFQTVMQLVDTLGLDVSVYTFDVWNLFNFFKPEGVRLVVDVSQTFSLKIRSFKLHKSQIVTMVTMLPAVYIKAILNGLRYGYKYVEVFDKAR